MDPQQAITLIREQVRATAEVVKAVNSGRGIVSKAKDRRERTAVANLFTAITGTVPTTEQLSLMVND